jgi:hypothetical protein
MSIMTTHTTPGVASRLGYGLGVIVRAVWFSSNPTWRWVKRLALITFAAYSWHWFAHAFLAVLMAGFVIAVVVVIFSSRRKETSNEVFGVGWQNGPDGWGYYDMYGNCHTFGDDDE